MKLVYHYGGAVLASLRNDTTAHIDSGTSSAQVRRLSLVRLFACLGGP